MRKELKSLLKQTRNLPLFLQQEQWRQVRSRRFLVQKSVTWFSGSKGYPSKKYLMGWIPLIIFRFEELQSSDLSFAEKAKLVSSEWQELKKGMTKKVFINC